MTNYFLNRPDGIQIRMVGPRDVTLRPEIERRIFDSDGNIIPNVPRGRRPVHCLETPTCCIHFKVCWRYLKLETNTTELWSFAIYRLILNGLAWNLLWVVYVIL